MRSKKPIKPHKKDLLWQQKVKKIVDDEKVDLDHSKGKERFDALIRHVVNKKRT
jgi:hypothetical protein